MNRSAGTMATRFVSQSGIFRITVSKSGPVIASFFGWKTRDDDGDERPAQQQRLIREREAYATSTLRKMKRSLI